MGDAARQGADRLHFLGLLQLGLKLFFFPGRLFLFSHINNAAFDIAVLRIYDGTDGYLGMGTVGANGHDFKSIDSAVFIQ